ncbi:MAG: NUDIX domain-containing protein [Candidatus Cloacimonetes bacterium]|nr:NUDIX domain-containing protein [Candidatus Cloacimonadota bacterium]
MVGAYGRKRGTAIIDTPKGILVVRQGRAKFLLPGGGVKKGESRIEAAIRELREETGLIAYDVHFLFEYQQSKVFFVRTNGTPYPKHEISQIGHYTRDSTLPLSYDTKSIIEKYWTMKAGL